MTVVSGQGSEIREQGTATPRTKTCPFTPASKDRFPHPNEQKSLATTPRSRVRFLGAPVVGDTESPGTLSPWGPRT